MKFIYSLQVNSALKSLSNSQLHQETLKAAAFEKSATLTLLEHLAEVDQRRLYSELGYQSLWEYTHQALHYSESQSSERVSAMRLMVKVPEIKTELEQGGLNLTAVSKLAYHVKREKLPAKDTVDLLAEIKNQPIKQVERILAKESTQPARPDLVKVITSETTRISIEVDLKFIELLNRAKELKGDLSLSPQEVFKLSLQEYVKKREVKKTSQPTPRAASLHSNEVTSDIQVKRSRYISTSVKTQVRLRSQDRCEYVDPQSNRRCTGKAGLQFDHTHPFALGGENTIENIRHLCANHNYYAALQIFGEEKINHFIQVRAK